MSVTGAIPLQDKDLPACQSPREEAFSMGEGKEVEVGGLTDLGEAEPAYSATFEQWDTYWEDLTRSVA